ncbi:MAG: hypothetical protein HRU13_12950 [Phycisphaerales bacterium]|nr:hypothetical protein [Phycisphaerales bacterium]
MATRRRALWDALKALYTADTGTGGLSEASGDNRIFEFLWEPGTTRARQAPSIYVEISSAQQGTLETDAELMLVRMHLYTNGKADDEFGPQDGISEQMDTLFNRSALAATGGHTFCEMRMRREFNAPSTSDHIHQVQEYTVLVS